jgi:chromosome segregation ATPase
LRNREHQFQLVRHKTETLQRTLDEQINYLKAEKANNQSLKIQNDSLVLQDQSNQKVLASLKNRINELELALHQSESKQNEIFALRNELTSTSAHLNNKEDVINSLRAEIDNLNARLNHAEHLKEIENVIKSQHWEQFGEIAENMKNLRKAISQSEPKVNHHQQHEQNIGFDHFVSSNHSSLNSDIVVNRLDQEIPQQDFTITFEPNAPKQEEE